MKLIVGLGNPGSEYAGTRHNTGFRAVDAFAKSLRGISQCRRWHGMATEAVFAGEKVFILKPMTYMNDSGRAVAAAIRELNPQWEDILIVFDDIALPLGTLRFRRRGSDGGQKGMLSILQAVGHQELPRLRLGIGADSLLIPREFVLQPFAQQELALVEAMLAEAAKAINLWMYRGITEAMSRYNGQVEISEQF
ncbi:MAG: aminoacyl-tRNA hydrolase [Eubacteriales bacterium]|jgi:PTH1 family peptidyl-tRNA hydrolase|nr:aminoacyl-tRNA hydrolase [Eubacteriales bacterium]